MKDTYELWTADNIQDVIKTANSSKNKQKTFGKLALKYNRSHHAIQKIYYKNKDKKTLNIPKADRDEAIKRLSSRGVTQREIAMRHKITQASVHHILNGDVKDFAERKPLKIQRKDPVAPVVVKQVAPKPIKETTPSPVVYTYELSILWGAFKITNKTINK